MIYNIHGAPLDIKEIGMKLYKNKMTNVAYADLSVYCNQNGKVIEDKGEYFEAVNPSEPSNEDRKEQVRAVRNLYLEQTDKYMIPDFPVTAAECKKYKAYRVYLRDYTLEDEWWLENPKTFEEWSGK